VCGACNWGGGGEDGVECVAYGVVEWCFGVFAGEEVVAVGIAELGAVAAWGWEGGKMGRPSLRWMMMMVMIAKT
jgi:hypothetical protein